MPSESNGDPKRSSYINPAPSKPDILLDSSGAYFRQAKPQYEGMTPFVATAHGISNDGTGDQTQAINALLAGNVRSVVFFLAGVYLVKGTVKVPIGTRMLGSGWSQIIGTRFAF